MDLIFSESWPDPAVYFDLFITTGWNDEYWLDADSLLAAIRLSWYFVAAYDGATLVGTGRIVSDGVLHALIVDVIVRPEYQGRGIGTRMMERLLARCRAAGLRDVQLFCARGKAPFYARLGFVPRPTEAPGMDWRSGAAPAG